MEWVNVHADKDQAQKMIESLPSLPVGTAWIWSPGWGDIFKRIAIRLRETFDSGATPQPGQTIKAPKKLAAIAIQETVDRKKENDPIALKKKVNELTKQLASVQPAASVKPERSVLDKEIKNIITSERREQVKFLQDFRKNFSDVIKGFEPMIKVLNLLNQLAKTLTDEIEILKGTPITIEMKNPVEYQQPESVSFSDYSRKNFGAVNNKDNPLPKCERAILTILAQRNGKDSSKSQLGILSGYSSKSGGFNNALSNLRQLAYLRGSGDHIGITADGISAIGEYNPLPTGEALRKYWINRLPKCESAILYYLIGISPNSKSKDEIGSHTHYSSNSGGFNNALSKLRTLELVENIGKNIKASSLLFEE